MAATAFSKAGWRPVVSLSVAGATVLLAFYGAFSIFMDASEADAQLRQFQDAYRTVLAADASSKTAAEQTTRTPLGQDLLSSDSSAALSLMQQRLQVLVVAPATLESLHSLEITPWRGLDVVHAAVRIRNLPPDQVLELIHSLEATRPAIVFNELSISTHVAPPPIGAVPPGAAAPTDWAELSGVVQTYAPRPTQNPPQDPGNDKP